MPRFPSLKEQIRSLNLFKKELDRLFERFFGVESGFVPAIDIAETDSDIIVQAEIPGIEPEDLDISLNGRLLTIKGEKKVKFEEKKESYHKIECRYGSFNRTVELPADVDPEKAEATYKNGILRIVLPKVEAGKRIKIKVA